MMSCMSTALLLVTAFKGPVIPESTKPSPVNVASELIVCRSLAMMALHLKSPEMPV